MLTSRHGNLSDRLNAEQISCIKPIIESYFAIIDEELGNNADLAVKALNAMKGKGVSITDVDTFVRLGLWSTIVQFRDILRHPCPQNSTEVIKAGEKATPYAILKIPRNTCTKDKHGMITLKNGRSFEAKYIILDDSDVSKDTIIVREIAGLLSLTTRDTADDTLSITKKALISYLFAMINDKINNLEAASKASSPDAVKTPSSTSAILVAQQAESEMRAKMKDSGQLIQIVYFYDEDDLNDRFNAMMSAENRREIDRFLRLQFNAPSAASSANYSSASATSHHSCECCRFFQYYQLQKAYELLKDHGLTLEQLSSWKKCPFTRKNDFTAVHRKLLTYLITGDEQRLDTTTITTLPAANRLTPEMAIAEINQLCESQADLLLRHYQHGLRAGDIRRVAQRHQFESPIVTGLFTHALLEQNLSPIDSVIFATDLFHSYERNKSAEMS